ncbi:MAG: alpha/beta hydrolase [Promethearchaeota archaeon]
MDYIEKELAGKPPAQIGEDMGQMMMKMAKLPGFLITWLFKKKIEDIRASMGGDPRDITTRPIIINNKTIQGYKSQFGIRIYSPEGDKIRPLMMFYHGGGWIGGSLKAVEEYCKAVSDQADCVVISVDYHLAPEHPFPEGLEDSYMAIKWAVASKNLIKIDENRITVSGDSAGGNFSAVLSFMARERKEFSIKKQILIYPGTDLVIKKDSAAPGEMPPKIGKAFYSLYTKRGTDMSHPYLSPIYEKDFTNLPEALVTVGDQDGLYKSSLIYANKLSDAGNNVKFILYKGANHAFIDDTGNSNQADDFVREAAAFIKQ